MSNFVANMRNLILFAMIACMPAGLHAQQAIAYTYDAAGNRTGRGVYYSLTEMEGDVQSEENAANGLERSLLKFDWKNLSINYTGGIIDKMYNPNKWASGFSPHVVTGNSMLEEIYSHELHHLWQSRAFNDVFLLNYGLQGINAWLLKGNFVKEKNYYEDFVDYYSWW